MIGFGNLEVDLSRKTMLHNKKINGKKWNDISQAVWTPQIRESIYSTMKNTKQGLSPDISVESNNYSFATRKQNLNSHFILYAQQGMEYSW